MMNIKENDKLKALNHSCAHLMAQAIKSLYPNALFWVGPVINEGFYYDIDLGDDVISEDDLSKIEKEMKRLAKKNKLIKREEISKTEAKEIFKDDPYKLDLINELDEQITVYRQDDFVDLCEGPHVESTKELRYFKLLKVSGAYYKGDVNNKMLQRVYGVCFADSESLDEHLAFLEEVKKRDHRKLGKELDLFLLCDYAPGSPFWLPNGMVIRKELENYWYEEHRREKYQFIMSPIMLNRDLWELSGHYENFKENMYFSEIDDKEYAIKPMNCPGGMLVYQNSLRSYRELPLRLAELGIVHRHEASGALNGLLRVRTITQDDAHIYMTEEQLENEIINLMKFIDRIYSVFNLTYTIELSTRPPEKYIGALEIWEKSEETLANACQKIGKEYTINPGDGAFYGPKLDFIVRDSLGRKWQCGTIQLDMNLPERFDLYYIAPDGSKKRPIMIHRVIYGALERFIGILIEHYAGAFPLWLAPVQVVVVPVNNEYHLNYAKELEELLKANDFRVMIDDRDEKVSYKTREWQMKKVPYVLFIGDQETDSDTVSFRKYGTNETENIGKASFVDKLKNQIKSKV